ncbi:MIF4G domain-containing protein B-like [Diadema setosum]|uniref:MIF4G domain-containing protein B-like n=1 Tax=Diadema setosum TaxID=31175 RepID=UPI003B3A6927
MASARHLNKDVSLRSATSRQKHHQPLSHERGGLGATTTDFSPVNPGSAGDSDASRQYEKERLIITLGEQFYQNVMVLAVQAARSTNEASFKDIVDGICKDTTNYISKEAQITAFALLMYHYGLDDVNNAENSARLCASLAHLEVNGTKFRSPLLKELEKDFTTRASWKGTDPNRWLAFCCYLCSLFRYLKIGGEFITLLIEPVFTCLESILSDSDASDEEIKCACNQLKELGSILDGLQQSQMEVLLKVIKEKLLGSQTSHFSRLLLLELVELRAGGWRLNDTQRQYYSEVFC